MSVSFPLCRAFRASACFMPQVVWLGEVRLTPKRPPVREESHVFKIKWTRKPDAESSAPFASMQQVASGLQI